MDRRERFEDLTEAVLAALQGFQSKVWTALPCIVESFNAAQMTCVLQPAIQAQLTKMDGSKEWITISLLLDVPVVFPSAGGFSLTFPVAPGDEVLAVFSSRCIDTWWQSGGFRNVQAELRMHDLSDGFAIPGIRSLPRVLPSISSDSTQLRNDAGTVYVEVEAGAVNVVAPVVNITAPTVNVLASTEVKMTTPELKVTGEITAREGTPGEIGLGAFGDLYNTHTHGGVQSGPDDTDPPNEQI